MGERERARKREEKKHQKCLEDSLPILHIEVCVLTVPIYFIYNICTGIQPIFPFNRRRAFTPGFAIFQFAIGH